MAASRPQLQTAISSISCDDFKNRLTGAGVALGFEMPSPKFERVPAPDFDYWSIFYSQKGNPVSDIEADMSCRNGAFQNFEFYDYAVHTPINVVSHPRTYHLLAAAVYAYTGWQPREVLKGASDLLESTKDGGSAGTIDLHLGGVAHLWLNTKTVGSAHLVIELGGDELR
jgi:hypothetical protein